MRTLLVDHRDFFHAKRLVYRHRQICWSFLESEILEFIWDVFDSSHVEEEGAAGYWRIRI